MRPAAGLEILVMTAGMLAAPPQPAGGQPGGERGAPRTPMIEALAPGAFDAGNALAEVHVRYRVDATVRVPLLFGSVPLADRTDVGVASFRVRDLPDPAGEGNRTLRAYEFFAASDPARARGLNRLGFLREAAWIEDHVTRRTVQFGVVSSDRSGSRAEAERSLDGGDPSRTQMVSVVDTVIGPGATRSEVVRLSVGGLWQRAGDLYDEVRPRWQAEHPDDAGTVVNDPPRYDRPVGFLGALQASLRQAAKAVASGAGRAGAHHRYVHDNELYALVRRESRTDAKRGRRYRDEGLIGAGDEVHRLDYRIQTAPGDGRSSRSASGSCCPPRQPGRRRTARQSCLWPSSSGRGSTSSSGPGASRRPPRRTSPRRRRRPSDDGVGLRAARRLTAPPAMSAAQRAAFAALHLYPRNHRPVQPLGARVLRRG